jgi:hypothetical protein
VSNYDKLLLGVWTVPLLILVLLDRTAAGLIGSIRHRRLVADTVRRMDLPLTPELVDAVARRLRVKHGFSARFALIAWLPGVAIIVITWRHTHSFSGDDLPSQALTLVMCAVASTFAIGSALGWQRCLSLPLTEGQGDQMARRPSPEVSDALPKWFRVLQPLILIYPVAAAIYFFSTSSRHRPLSDLEVGLWALVAVGAYVGFGLWQARIMRVPRPAMAALPELVVDDTMRVECVLDLACDRWYGSWLVTAIILDAASTSAAQPWLQLSWLVPALLYQTLFQAYNSSPSKRLLLWHRSRFAARYAVLNADPS